jgi:TolB protein
MTGSPFYWQWSADGDSLLAHVGLSGPGARLGFSGVAADTLEQNLDAPGFFQAPAISPSGRWLAYATDRGGARAVIVRSAPGLTVEPIEREVRHIGLTALTFSPTEDRLALMRPPEDAPFIFGAISLLDAETGLLEPLVDESALAFFWSPDGRRIAYLTFAPRGGEIAGPQGASVQVRAEQQRPPRFTLKVVEVADGRVVDLGAFVPSRLFVQQFLPFFDQYALSHRIWSPGSEALVLPILDEEGRSQVTVFTLDGERRTVIAGDGPFWNVR